MNLDGTGFQKLFTQSHHWCENYSIDCIQDGYLYYSAHTVFDRIVSLLGNFRVRLDGSEHTQIFKGPPAGTVVEPVGKSGSDWGKVAYNGGEYYVWFARLKKIN